MSIWHWLVIALLVGAVAVFAKRAGQTDHAGSPVGIGGWLILPIIGFIGTVALTVKNLAEAFFEIEGMKAIIFAEQGPLVQLKAPVFVSTLFGVLVIGSASYCLLLIFRKRSGLVKVATWHYIILAATGFAEHWADFQVRIAFPETPEDRSIIYNLIRGVLIAAIWIPYFRMSRRVKNTFEAKITAEQYEALGSKPPTVERAQ